MRKWIAMLLALSLVWSLAACGGADTPEQPAEDGQPAGTDPETPDPEPDTEAPSEPETDPDVPAEEETAAPLAALQVTTGSVQHTDDAGSLLLQENLLEASVTLADGGEAEAAINEALSAYHAYREAQAASCLEMAREAQAASAETGLPFTGYAVTDQADAGRVDGAVVSVVFTAVDNTGGAHGNTAATAMNFEAATGRQLTVADLGDDREALNGAVTAAVEAAIAANPEGYYPYAADEAASLLTDGGWYFSDQGLTVLCDPYRMAPYAAGVLRFTVPYAELTGILADDWMPGTAAEGGGTPEAALAEDGVPDAIAAVTADEGGSPIAVTTDGPLRDVRVRRVSSTDGETWYAGALCLYLNRLLPGETVSVAAMLPDAMTNLMLTCETDNGTACYGFFQSGKDGSVFLLPLEQVVF